MMNSDVNAILAQIQAETVVRTKDENKTAYDPKNYLNVRLAPNESSRTLTVRLLPYLDEATPFHKVHFHTIKVNKEVAASGWKTIPCPNKNKHGDGSCPICDLAAEAKKLKEETTNKAEKDRYFTIEKENRPREMFVVRCIERGHEDEGVKYWLFPRAYDGKGVYDQMINIFTSLRDGALRRGEDYNVFDVNNGRDLNIKLTRNANGRVSPQITYDEFRTPLSEDATQMNQWLSDTKTWSDVYTFKRPDFMQILIENGVPVFDKDSNKFVNKADLQMEQQEKRNQEIAEKLTTPKVDYSMAQPIEETSGLVGMSAAEPVSQPTLQPTSHTVPTPPTVEEDDDDLPF